MLKLMLIAFVLIQPVFDCYYFYTEQLASVIGFTVPPLLAVAWLGAMLVLYFVSDFSHFKKKTSVILFSYLAVCLAYFVIHHLTNVNFKSVGPDDYGYSIFNEAYYVIRILIPYFIVFLTYELSLSKEEFYRCIESLCVVITSVIVISNLLCVSLSSYTNETISANIFSWFTHMDDYNAKELTSKGFFCYANQTAGLTMLLFPILLYRMVVKFKPWRVILAAAQAVAMIMLGTQTSSYGVILEIIVFAAVMIFSAIILKQFNRDSLMRRRKVIVSFCLVAIIAGGLLPFSPVISKQAATTRLQADRAKVEKSLKVKKNEAYYQLSFDDRVKYMNKNFEKYSLQWSFSKVAYPLDYDPDFWYEMMKLPIQQRFEFRFVETSIMDAVKATNDDPMDKWFGISATREANICKIERDYLAQYYSMGIVGVIVFFAPLVLFAAYISLRCLFRKNWDNIFENLTLAMSLDIVLAIGYVTGNCLDVLFTTVIVGLLCGRILLNMRDDKKNHTEALPIE